MMEIVCVCIEDANIVPQIPPQLAVRPPSKAGLQCCIFLDFHAPDQCVSCANGHHVSQNALGKYLQMELEKPLEYHQKLQGLKCPQCPLAFPGERVTSLVSPELGKQFLDMVERCRDKSAYEEEVAGKEDLDTIQECIRLQFRNQKNEYVGCYMCPDCGFGPIDKMACDDMRAHHFQRKGDTFIDNSCPICHFFSGGISKWKKWDGSFLPGDKVMKMRKIGEEVKYGSNSKLADLEAQLLEVDVDSEAKWMAETADYQAYRAECAARLAKANCRPANEISLEMRECADSDRLAQLGREFQRSLRIYNPRVATWKFGATSIATTCNGWVLQKKKSLRKLIKTELQRVRKEIHDEVLKFNNNNIQG